MEKYQKIKLIGRGAYGIVYLCRRVSNDKRLILKEIPVDQMTAEERQASLQEAQILSILNHPNIIACYDNFLDKNMMVICMEYASGGTLYEYLQEQKGNLLNGKKVMSLFCQLAMGLQHVHLKSILHRDLKSQNILMNMDRSIVKIGDFGISKLLTTKSKALTVVGTPYYISPELCEGKPYDQKSDIWALGCILYELLTLKRPFEGDNLPALVTNIMRGEFEPVSDNYCEDIRVLLKNMLHTNPEKRPNTCEIFCLPFMIESFFQLQCNFGSLPCNAQSSGNSSCTVVRFTAEPEHSSEVDSSCSIWLIRNETKDLVQLPLPEGIECTNIKDASLQVHWAMAITQSGVLIVWDLLDPVSDDNIRERPVDILYVPRVIEEDTSSGFTSIACGAGFAVCLSKSGIISTFGKWASKCLAHTERKNLTYPEPVQDLFGFNIKSCSCGPNHVLAISENNDLFSWGHNTESCLGIEYHICAPYPQRLALKGPPKKIANVFCGPTSSFVLTEDKELWACGSNLYNEIGMQNEDQLPMETVQEIIPVQSKSLSSIKVQSVAAASTHTAILSENGKVYTIGSNAYGQLGWGETRYTSNEAGLVDVIQSHHIVQVACSDYYTLALTQGGQLYVWGQYPELLHDKKCEGVVPVNHRYLTRRRKVTFVTGCESQCLIVTKP